MAIDASIPRTRRALLAGGIGGLAALVASALGRPLPAEAASGSFSSADASTPAVLATNTAAEGYPALGVYGRSDSGNGYGVHGEATHTTGWGRGVLGESYGNGREAAGVEGLALAASGSTRGVYGQSFSTSGTGVCGYAGALTGYTTGVYALVRSPDGTAVIGYSGTGDSPSPVAKTGVYGYAIQDSGSRGVHGRSTAGRGVYGQATSGLGVRGYATSGVGVSAEATSGYALRTSGRIKAEQVSGVTTIAAGTTSTDVVLGVNVTSTSFVLLTPRGNLGGRSLWYTVDTVNDRITVRISSKMTADLKVGWLLLG